MTARSGDSLAAAVCKSAGRGMGEIVYAQVQFNLYRPGEWVTIGAGVQDDVVRAAASGLYGRVASPQGDVPYRVRVHRTSDETEEARAAIDLRVSAEWQPAPP
jgi:hypothetical protein